jgi:lipopolysaccharide/colanic/teichoic acid biosynthesis glycosyltransferase
MVRDALYRAFDVICAAAGLATMIPVLLVLAAVILLYDGPPVFFSQMRVGKNGRPFRIWKFRTMHAGSDGTVVTAAGDDRITRSGAVLRRYKFDELPQLFNVLRGEMSLVGPRPEVPEFVQLEAPIWQAVLQVRPGVTDLATLLYRDEEKRLGGASNLHTVYRESVLPEKLMLNLGYMRSRSFLNDLRLIYLTVRYSLFPRQFDPDRVMRIINSGVPR